MPERSALGRNKETLMDCAANDLMHSAPGVKFERVKLDQRLDTTGYELKRLRTNSSGDCALSLTRAR